MPNDDPTLRSDRRYTSMDATRGAAMLGGVVLHAAVPYMQAPVPGLLWPIQEPSTGATYDILFWWLHSFRIPLFFVIAGFFSAMLIVKRGPDAFLAHRTRRVAIPYLLAIPLVLGPMYVIFATGWWRSDRATLDEILRWNYYAPEIQSDLVGPAHLWFLGDLFLMCMIVWAVVRITRGRCALPRSFDVVLRSPFRLLVLIWPAMILVFANPQIVYGFRNAFVPAPLALLYHASFFLTGFWLYRLRDELGRLSRGAILHLVVGTAAFTGIWLCGRGSLDVPFEDGLVALLTTIAAWAYALGFLGLTVRLESHAGRRTRFIADASYWIYLVHLPIVALIQVAMFELPLPALVKFLSQIIITTAICLLTYRMFVRYTFLGRALNGPRSRPGVSPLTATPTAP